MRLLFKCQKFGCTFNRPKNYACIDLMRTRAEVNDTELAENLFIFSDLANGFTVANSFMCLYLFTDWIIFILSSSTDAIKVSFSITGSKIRIMKETERSR